jgi:arsenate reductase
MTDEEVIKAIIEHPKLMERPIVTTNKKAIIGRPPKNVLSLFD